MEASLNTEELRALDKEALIGMLVLLHGQMQGLVEQMESKRSANPSPPIPSAPLAGPGASCYAVTVSAQGD